MLNLFSLLWLNLNPEPAKALKVSMLIQDVY